MNLTDLTIKDLFSDNSKLTFLVGAGCSADPPSCLPMGHTMMEAIIKYTCAESEIKKLLNLVESRKLRFEWLMEIISDNLDKEFKIIDYYSQCNKPNLQHFFLADMIRKGQFIMTTNFDFLIEYALLQSGVPNDEIIPIITKKDFEKSNNLLKLFEEGKMAIFKIHGSTRNLITNEDTRSSLIATIRALGKNKEGMNIFHVEPFKRPLFDNITFERSLVVMGYSGSDDFDIIPTLKSLRNLRSLIWINHTKDRESGNEIISEIIGDNEQYSNSSDENTNRVTHILGKLKHMNIAHHIYRVDVNTSSMAANLLKNPPLFNSHPFSIKPINWLEKHLKIPFDLMTSLKYFIPYEIYFSLNKYDLSMECIQKLIPITETSKDHSIKGNVLQCIAKNNFVKGNYPKAMEFYEKALKIFQEINFLEAMANVLGDMAGIYNIQGDIPEAIDHYSKAMNIFLGLEDMSNMAICLSNIGLIFMNKGKYKISLRFFKQSLKIDEELGNLSSVAINLNNMASVYSSQGNYTEALRKYDLALEIHKKLGDMTGVANKLNNIGTIYEIQGNYLEAIKYYNLALKINKQIGNLYGIAANIQNIGILHQKLGNYEKALKVYRKSLEVDKKLDNLSGIAENLNCIGLIQVKAKNYIGALDTFKKSMQINRKLGNLNGKASNLNNIGLVYQYLEKNQNALKYYKKALETVNEIRNLNSKAMISANIGSIYFKEKKFNNARKHLEEALNIYSELELSQSEESQKINEILNSIENKFQRAPKKKIKKPERNKPCPCGSGKKYKNCCGKF